MNVNKCDKDALGKAIKIAGGANELANKIGVSYTTILAWKNGRTGMSVTNCIKIEQTVERNVKKEEILPDYPWDKLNLQEKKDEKLEIAKNLLAAGIDIDTIAKTTGISREELEKVQI